MGHGDHVVTGAAGHCDGYHRDLLGQLGACIREGFDILRGKGRSVIEAVGVDRSGNRDRAATGEALDNDVDAVAGGVDAVSVCELVREDPLAELKNVRAAGIDDQVVATRVLAVVRIVASATIEIVPVRSAIEIVVTVVADEDVIAAPAEEVVDTVATGELVAAFSPNQEVIVVFAETDVLPGTAFDTVVPGAGGQEGCTCATDQRVHPCSTIHRCATVRRTEPIVAVVTHEERLPRPPVFLHDSISSEDVVAVATEEIALSGDFVVAGLSIIKLYEPVEPTMKSLPSPPQARLNRSSSPSTPKSM